VLVIGPPDAGVIAGLRARHILTYAATRFDQIDAVLAQIGATPDGVVIDIRAMSTLPGEVGQLRKRFPNAGLVILARALDSRVLLEAMRIGVNECVAEPLDLDRLAAALVRVGQPSTEAAAPVLAVLGAKGGVGSTTVAVNLAAALYAVKRHPTLLIDLHLAHGDAAVFLGANPRFSVIDALDNVDRLDESYFNGLIVSTSCGVHLLACGDRSTTRGVDAGALRALLQLAATTHRHVVVDCPRTDPIVLAAVEAESRITVVVNQEVPTLRSAGRLLDGLRQRCSSDRIRLAISRFDPKAEIAVADVERTLGSPVDYQFPSDYRLAAAAITRGVPLVVRNQSALAGAFEVFARQFAGLPAPAQAAPKTGMFGRFGARRERNLIEVTNANGD